MGAATLSQDKRRTKIIAARMLCFAGRWVAIGLALATFFLAQLEKANLLAVVLLLILAAIAFSYVGSRLEKATPALPVDDEDHVGSIDFGEAAPARLDPATVGAICGFIWGPPP